VAYERSELSLLLACLLCGCTAAPEKPAALKLTSEETMALTMRVIDCETKAANRYDDGNPTISSLAHQIMMICQYCCPPSRALAPLLPQLVQP
jgi:hypothetical protein